MSQNLVDSWQVKLTGDVLDVSISQESERIIAGTADKKAFCLNLSGDMLWQQPTGNQAWRTGLSSDGKTAVIGTGSTRPWDMKGRGLYCFDGSGNLRWKKDLAASIWGLACSADGNTIAAGTSAKQLLLFDKQGHCLWQHDIPGIGWWAWVWSASLSADGQIVAAGSADKHIRIWERNGQLLAEHRTQGDVFATAVSANGDIIAAGDNSGQIYCLDRNGNLLWQQPLKDKVWAVALSADGKRLLVGMGEKEIHIHLYNLAGRFLWKRHVGHSVTNVGLSADGRRIVAGTRQGGIYIFDEESVIHTAQANKIVRDVAITANGEWVVAGSEDGYVYSFHLSPANPEIVEPGNIAANELYQLIIGRFSLPELKTLYFYLGIEIDDVPGETRPEKARELVKFMAQANRLDDLKETIKQNRSDIEWKDYNFH